MAVLHSKRLSPSRGFTARGEEIPPDYIVTDKPLGRTYTEEVTKMVSRPKDQMGTKERVMRPKTSKIKFVLLDPEDVTQEIKRSAYDFNWAPALFKDATEDVIPPPLVEARV